MVRLVRLVRNGRGGQSSIALLPNVFILPSKIDRIASHRLEFGCSSRPAAAAWLPFSHELELEVVYSFSSVLTG